MTLSHCRGKASFIKYTAETSAGLFAGIEIAILPQTFRDAIHVALQLGVRYLWVDSLCIAQDDEEDWTRESTSMGLVYKHGYCNIAATASSASDFGFMEKSPWTLSLAPPRYVQSTWRNAGGARNAYWRVYCNIDLMEHSLDGPLLSRGWVVQERFLSPRTLHFCKNQMYWECQEHDTCETYPNGLPTTLLGLSILMSRRQPLYRCADTLGVRALWENIAEVFSKCTLTMEKDKLPALSGIAKMIREIGRP